MAKSPPARFDVLAATRGRRPDDGNGRRRIPSVSDIFGTRTFGMAEMKARLPKDVFRKLQ